MNGKRILEPGYRVESSDLVEFDGREVRLPQQWSYYALNKPVGYVVSRAVFRREKNIYELLPNHLQNLAYAGRLDRESSGLLLLSNDGQFIQKVIDRDRHLPRRYRLRVDRLPLQRGWQKMFLRGLKIEGQRMQVAALTILDRRQGRLDLTLLEGRNRQIRRMFAAFGSEVVELYRYAIGGLYLGRMQLPAGKVASFQPQAVLGAYSAYD